ncbi:MAG: response regulator transcription factor [Mucilaginibacter polytrichastri]|nr:response regulator transcription factor [Mucilaginibacter polytrichastri]
MPIKTLAIDDEPIALDVIRAHAGKVPYLQMDGFFTNAFQALDQLAAQPADLLFLDIKMPDISGIDLLASLPRKPLVIFTTAYSEHAVQSYELDAVDYLLKPFSLPRFLKACGKAREILSQKKEGENGSVFIKTGYEQVKVDFSEILFIESAGNYMQFILDDDRRILSRLTMSGALALLPVQHFVRVHRSFVVNRQKITRMERHQVHTGQYIVPLSPGFQAAQLG